MSNNRIAELRRQEPWFGWSSESPAPEWAQEIINTWIQYGTVPGVIGPASIDNLRNYLSSKMGPLAIPRTIMNIDEYTQAAKALITPRVQDLINDPSADYLALGLIGETGEVAEHVKKYLRDDEGFLTEDRRQKLIKELGDVLWYAAVRADREGDVLDLNTKGFRKPADAVRKLAQAAASESAHSVVTYLASLALWCGVTLEEVARLNIEKLNDRRDRGVLHGSGDSR